VSVELTLADLNVPARSDATLDAAHVERIAATLDAPVPGTVLPSLWHWAFFTPTTATAGLGTDGHPVLSSPALAPFPRRMWGAGDVTWEGDLEVGASAERVTTLNSVRQVEGGSGTLLIVRLAHAYSQDGEVRLREQQTIVYRDPPADAVKLPIDGPPPAPPDGAWTEERRPGPALLFRFSAITFNSHRIHYDVPYAAEVEGYPGLVVHGPLTALTVAGFVERCTNARLASFDFRATAPMFVDQRSTIVCAPPDGDGAGTAHVVRNDGATAMQVAYRLR
jgi:hydroxyacyl-ACP dehydratase HTD2-like protein with hotdog domain